MLFSIKSSYNNNYPKNKPFNKLIQNNTCINCGKPGHIFYQCKLSIISYGIIAFQIIRDIPRFLIVRRKHSFGYTSIIRGKYSLNNIFQLQQYIDEMTLEEKEFLYSLNTDMSPISCNVWDYKNKLSEKPINKKLGSLISGININGKTITLKYLIDNSSTTWKEQEWEFPKGRRDINESDLSCALREFSEETGIVKSKLQVINNILPFIEHVMGTDNKMYKFKYFLANINETEILLDKFQTSEISDLQWKTYEECIECIRPYNIEKQKLIYNINKVICDYSLYS